MEALQGPASLHPWDRWTYGDPETYPSLNKRQECGMIKLLGRLPTSTFKFYCPSCISVVFHTPTLMNNIFQENEREGSIDLSGLLLDQMMTVGLVTEEGIIKVRDIWL